MVHNIEILPGAGGAFARSAGVSAQLMAKTGKYALLRMPFRRAKKNSFNLYGDNWCYG